MKDTFLIGLTGKAGSGKDTVAQMLGYCTYAFAAPLKNALAAMGFPEPERSQKEELIPGFDFSWREAAQKLGTEWGRGLQSDIWLTMAERERAASKVEFLVVTDVRFHNEADWVRDHGVLVHVLGRQSELVGKTATHASETVLPCHPDDYVIPNIGSVNDLKMHTHRLVELIAQR